MTDSPVQLRRFAIPPGPTTDPTLQDVIAHRLRRFPNLTDDQIAGLIQTLDPNVVEAVSDGVLAQMVAGTLPTQPLQPGGGMPLGLPGAQTLSRFAGGTDSGAPTSGTFHQGDFVVAADAHIFVCTVAGTPGTWVDAALAGIVTSPDATASVKGLLKLTGDLGGTASSPTVPGLAGKAPLASPALTGTPTAPTATPGTATTQVATTAFTAAAVAAQSGTYAPAAQGLLEGSGAPSNSLGVNTQMYYDVTNKVLYGPKASGVWPTPGLSLAGEALSVGGGLRGDLVPQPFVSPLTAQVRALTTAGRTWLLRYVPPRTRALTLAGFVVSAADTVNDPIEVGLYTVGASTLTRVATSGSQSGLLNATGPKTAPLSYTVDPSVVYYVALATSAVAGTGGTVIGVQSSTADSSSMFGTSAPNANWGLIDGALSGGLLPATITTSGVSWAPTTTAPSVALREV